jgi:hypothetical protein
MVDGLNSFITFKLKNNEGIERPDAQLFEVNVIVCFVLHYLLIHALKVSLNKFISAVKMDNIQLLLIIFAN